MNSYPTITSNMIYKIKSEDVQDKIYDLSRDLNGQKQDYEQEIDRLKKVHNEQISKFRHEIERHSSLVHQYRSEIDLMRKTIYVNEKQYHESSLTQDLQTKNLQLFNENTKLKKELLLLAKKYRTVFNEIQEARKYLLNLLANSD